MIQLKVGGFLLELKVLEIAVAGLQDVPGDY